MTVCVYAILNERPREGKQIFWAEIVKRYCNHETRRFNEIEVEGNIENGRLKKKTACTEREGERERASKRERNIERTHIKLIQNEVMKSLWKKKEHITEMLCAYFIVYCILFGAPLSSPSSSSSFRMILLYIGYFLCYYFWLGCLFNAHRRASQSLNRYIVCDATCVSKKKL